MPNTPPRYHRDYANAVSDIYQNMGRAQAEARLQQGGIWANAFGQIGQTVSAIPGQLQAQKDAEAQRQRMAKQDALSDVQRELAELNLEKARREDAEDMVLNQLISTSVDQSGKFDPDLFSKNASELGFGQFIAPTLSEHAKTEAIKLQLQAGRISAAQAERQILSNYALNLWQNAFDPQVVQATWAKLKTDGMSDETIAQYKAMPTADFVSAVMGLLPKRKPAEEVTLNEGQVRRVPMQTVFGQDILDEQGQPRYTEIRGPEKPKTPPVGSFEDYVTALHGPRPTPAQIASARRSYGEAGRAPSVTVNMPEAVMPPSDVNSQDIMSQAGLSRNGFLALTNPTMLPRDQATRNNASKEVEAWARAKGIDVSTFQSRYASYNKVLTNNTMRLDTVQNIEQDLLGTIQNLQTAANEAGMSDVTAANAVKLWLNNNLNDPKAINYAANLQALVSDIARYNAASSSPDGDRQPLESDMAAARNLLKQGISAGGLDGLLKAVQANVANMDRVNKAAVDRSQKAVWTLFGVGDKYKPTAGSANLIFDPATKTFKKGGL
jgi:hypothetical protein